MTEIIEPAPDLDTEVIICGGGPAGLSMAYLLGRAGIRVQLFEKRASTTTLPKGQYMHAHTSELFRRWGVWQRLEDSGWRINQSNGQGFYVNVAKGPVGEVRANWGTEADYEKKWAKLSPVFPRKIPASDYEAALFHQAAQWPNVTLNFSAKVVGAENLSNGVQVGIRNVNTGQVGNVQARYLVASDGAHSFVRNRLGEGEDHGPAFENQILVEFSADLEETLGRDGFFHSFIMDQRYSGWFGSQHPDTGLWRYSFRHDEDTLPPEEVIMERLHGALGMPDLPIEIVQIFRFDYTTGLLRDWRHGNVYFVGDAAHWHSPWGGFGANSSIQDASNLAWKLALAVRGVASTQLLKTYEVERKPKALQGVKSATYNSLNFQAIVQSAIIGEPDLATYGILSEAALQFLEERLEVHGTNAVLHTGYQMGTVYKSDAVITDGIEAPSATLKDYVESTAPGARAPHAWLSNKAGERVSTIDLWGDGFCLVATADSATWQRHAQQVSADSGVQLIVLNIRNDGDYVPADDKFSKLYTVGSAGTMTLVRPDGYVARRFSGDATKDGLAFLEDTFEQILDCSFAASDDQKQSALQ